MRHGRYFGGEYEYFDVREEVALFVLGKRRNFWKKSIVSTVILRWNVLSSDSETVRCHAIFVSVCLIFHYRELYIYIVYIVLYSHFFYTFPPSPLNA